MKRVRRSRSLSLSSSDDASDVAPRPKLQRRRTLSPLKADNVIELFGPSDSDSSQSDHMRIDASPQGIETIKAWSFTDISIALDPTLDLDTTSEETKGDDFDTMVRDPLLSDRALYALNVNLRSVHQHLTQERYLKAASERICAARALLASRAFTRPLTESENTQELAYMRCGTSQFESFDEFAQTTKRAPEDLVYTLEALAFLDVFFRTVWPNAYNSRRAFKEITGDDALTLATDYLADDDIRCLSLSIQRHAVYKHIPVDVASMIQLVSSLEEDDFTVEGHLEAQKLLW